MNMCIAEFGNKRPTIVKMAEIISDSKKQIGSTRNCLQVLGIFLCDAQLVPEASWACANYDNF